VRIRLIQGKQKEIIERLNEDYSWLELSKLLHISENYLRDELRNEQRLLSDEIYTKIKKIAHKDLDNFITERLEDNWGRVKGGKNSPGSLKKINLPEESEGLAEFYGIMLGDGNLTIRKAYKIGTYQIRIVGDSRYDKDYLAGYVKPLIERLFNLKVKISLSRYSNALFLTITSKELAEFLKTKGFKSGDKIRNQLEIPSWIKVNNDFLRKCLRGLYDTDGSIYKLTNQNSHQISFTNYNKALLNDVRGSLLSLGVGVLQITKGKEILITKKSELRKFLNEVGFSNFKHLNKVKRWNLVP